MSNQDWGDPGHGIGRRQQGGGIEDHLRPGQEPQPSEGYKGPPIAVPLEGWQKMVGVIDQLGQQMGFETRPDWVTGIATGQTDSEGLLYMPIYRVAAGMEGTMHRFVLNAVNPATNVPYTAASTFAASSAYLELHVTDSGNADAFGFTSLRDFAPPTAGGPIFPGLFEYGHQQSPIARGPQEFALKVFAGPHSTIVMAAYKIRLTRMKGVA